MPLEYKALWTSGVTGPGVTVVHGRDTAAGSLGEASQELANRLQLFMFNISVTLPTDVLITFPPEAIQYNTATGAIESVHTLDPPDPVPGNASAAIYAAPAGGRIRWTTEALVGGEVVPPRIHRLMGRTFLVPMATNSYESNGTLTSGTVAALSAAAATYYDEPFEIEAVAPSIWSRTYGIAADITGHFVPDEVAILTSRRD